MNETRVLRFMLTELGTCGDVPWIEGTVQLVMAREECSVVMLDKINMKKLILL